MSDLSPLSDLVADDLFLDRLAGRVDAGSDPVAGLLGALAAQADAPLSLRTGRRRIGHKHRYLGAFAALAVAASGAGVAAAVTVPSHGPSRADRALAVTLTDDSARGHAPVVPLSRLGLPQASRSTQAQAQAQALVLARRDDGAIVLVPAAFVAAPARPGGATHGTREAGNAETDDAETGNGEHQSGGKHAGAAPASTNGKKSSPATKGSKGIKGTKDRDREGKNVKKPSTTATPPTAPSTNPGAGHPGGGRVPSADSAVSSVLHGASATGRPTP